MKPHKHAELIKAWADGAEIQFRFISIDSDEWTDWKDTPKDFVIWKTDSDFEYRIKPEPKTEPEKQWMYIYCNAHENKTWISPIEPSYYMNVAHWTCIGKIEVLK